MISPLVRALPRTYIPSTSFAIGREVQQYDEHSSKNLHPSRRVLSNLGGLLRSDNNDEKKGEQYSSCSYPMVSGNNSSDEGGSISHNILSSTQWDINPIDSYTLAAQSLQNQSISKCLTDVLTNGNVNNIKAVTPNDSTCENPATTTTTTTTVSTSHSIKRVIDPRSQPRLGFNGSNSSSSTETSFQSNPNIPVEKVQSTATTAKSTREDRISLAKEILQYVEEVKNQITLLDHG